MIFSILDLIKTEISLSPSGKYFIIEAAPAAGVLNIPVASPYSISGDVHLRGRNNGGYPYKHLDMIDAVFGPENNTIEVSSGSVSSGRLAREHSSCRIDGTVTVDINPRTRPDIEDDAQVLSKVESNRFNRWRCDPPYNEQTAKEMYGTEIPNTYKLLEAGARVCKPKSLMFLLLGPQNIQNVLQVLNELGGFLSV